VAGAKVIS